MSTFFLLVIFLLSFYLPQFFFGFLITLNYFFTDEHQETNVLGALECCIHLPSLLWNLTVSIDTLIKANNYNV